MSTKKITSELRLAYWAQVMQERAESGLNVKTYCEKIGIKANTYFYWQTKLRKTISDQLTETNPLQLVSTGFVEVKKDETAQKLQPVLSNHDELVHIEIDGARISVKSTYPVERLIELLRGLMRL